MIPQSSNINYSKVNQQFKEKIGTYFNLPKTWLSVLESESFIIEKKMWWYIRSSTWNLYAILGDIDEVKWELYNLKCRLITDKSISTE